ncbi:MAG TPA: pyridoxamine 5'-phosphate oxidase family protein [Candidatus Dormibacteraeota bacterium]|nr:pyridoxamine 5'-phosphate oxidase family protein [Candidatus Dormibacteraeota bacterium]
MSSAPSPRIRLQRKPDRGLYERAEIDAILDAGLICHVGYVIDGQPFVTPTSHWRVGGRVYWHGSSASRMLRRLAEGLPACLTVTHLDGIVLARSGYHHSMNYRSVMALGTARAVEDPEEKEHALRDFMERLAPGRWDEVRPPTDGERKATTVVWMDLDEASAKVRIGPPGDDEADYALDCWAGVVPVSVVAGRPEADPRLRPGIPEPAYLRTMRVG